MEQNTFLIKNRVIYFTCSCNEKYDFDCRRIITRETILKCDCGHTYKFIDRSFETGSKMIYKLLRDETSVTNNEIPPDDGEEIPS
jgi:hypothetical protein